MEIRNSFDLVNIFIHASGVTIEVAFLSIIIAFIIGLICSIALYYKITVVKAIIYMYVEFFRNTPSLVQVYFVFYGLPKIFVKLDSFTCSVLVLSLLGGAYMCEAMYAGMKVISKNQRELAMAIGLSKFDTIRYLILPQTISISIAAINNNAIFLTKEVSVMKIILLPEIVYQAFAIISLRADLTVPIMILMIVSYLVILIPMSYGFSVLERKVRFAEFGD
ncbi:MAG: ABC transporter permease subunit [Pelosinus sp.]|nr:ABC transporter permease subunit [Pelosinus sp.]